MQYRREIYTQELEFQARKDYDSAKKLLLETNDIGNVLFLFEQSYEKILKSVYVYCQCVAFNYDFEKLLEDNRTLTHRHESGSEYIQTILPNLLKNYKKTVEILDEKLAKDISSNKMPIAKMIDLYGLITIPPKYKELIKKQKQVKKIGKKVTDWNNTKNDNQQNKSYQLWLDFLNQLQTNRYTIEKVLNEFNLEYNPFEMKIQKNVNNFIGFKEKIKNATLFLSLAVILSPISLAYKYTRYPVKEANFKNLRSFYKENTSNLKNGLEEIGKMVEYLIKSKDDFSSLILGHKKLQQKSRRWKRKEEKIARKDKR